jgi:hypothetical protein
VLSHEVVTAELAEVAEPCGPNSAPPAIERLLNHRLGVICNKAESTCKRLSEIYIRYSYPPQKRKANRAVGSAFENFLE